ncbi:hypothetical protein C8Q80DRAFT_372110 [Daedaleopsis nitida]|nr:hypothetical protein C8Q80DRAFT_372110 [Daedaleopsis nitida]
MPHNYSARPSRTTHKSYIRVGSSRCQYDWSRSTFQPKVWTGLFASSSDLLRRCHVARRIGLWQDDDWPEGRTTVAIGRSAYSCRSRPRFETRSPDNSIPRTSLAVHERRIPDAFWFTYVYDIPSGCDRRTQSYCYYTMHYVCWCAQSNAIRGIRHRADDRRVHVLFPPNILIELPLAVGCSVGPASAIGWPPNDGRSSSSAQLWSSFCIAPSRCTV